DGHGAPRVRDDELRHVELEGPLDDESHRPVGDGLGREVVTVDAGSRDAEEESPRPGCAGVVGEVADLHGSASQYVRGGERCDDAGAATTPPQIAPCGSSTETRITSRGRDAGTIPTNEAT